MNIQHLKLFVRVAALHNISQAGNELGLSAAVASAQLNKLEQSLGVCLLHRSTRRVALTDEGEAFLPHAEDVLASVEAAQDVIVGARSEPVGTLRIAASASFGRMHLVPALAAFNLHYPRLNVDLRLSDTIVDLIEGGFDIAIRIAALQDSTLMARKLATDKRILFASPAYLARHGTPQSLEQLKEHNCITLSGLDLWAFDSAEGIKTVKVQGSLRTDNGEAVRDACVAGMGLALSSTWCAYHHVQRGELVPILTEFPVQERTAIWSVRPNARTMPLRVRVFIDFLMERFGSPPYWDLVQ
ncbi:LysR family transcriptional regulator [Aeromonas veronii]|nr:LysR family transcriptional regulator [Aeromonas veronii]